MDKKVLYNNTMITDPNNIQRMYEYLYSHGYLIRKDIDKLDIEEFNQGFVGFIDGDGSFGVTKVDSEYTCILNIRLHSDDRDLLYIIQYKLDMPVKVRVVEKDFVVYILIRGRK